MFESRYEKDFFGHETLTDGLCYLGPHTVFYYFIHSKDDSTNKTITFTIEDLYTSLVSIMNSGHLVAPGFKRWELINYLEYFSSKYPALCVYGREEYTFDYEKFYEYIPYDFYKKIDAALHECNYRTLHLANCCDLSIYHMDKHLLMYLGLGFMIK